jgi:hypothetical protein
MDQAYFQGALEGSLPVLFNQQQGNDPESINLALGDLSSFHAGFLGFATPGVSLPSGPYFSGFLPPSPAYIDLEQSLGASLLPRPNFPGPASHAASPLPSPDFSGFLPPSPAYIDFEQSLHASLIPSPANAALSGFEEAASTCAACTGFEQVSGGSVPPSSAYDINHAALSGFGEVPTGSQALSPAWIGYRSQTNKPPLPQPLLDYGEDFPNYALLNQITLTLNSAHRECQYPANDENTQQNTLSWLQHQSNTVGLRHYDGSNHVPSYFEQILPVTSNSRLKPPRCIRCRKQGRTVFVSS